MDDAQGARHMWSIKQLADFLGESEETARKFCRQGRVKAVKVGQSWRISEREVNRIEREGVPDLLARQRRRT